MESPLPRTLSRNRTWQDPGDKMRVAVYGGSFDPITNAHLTCVSEIVHSGKVDEVWIVPCGPRPDKPSLRTSALERLVMCHLAVDATFGTTFPVRVNDVEIMRPASIPTYDLMTMFRDQHPDVEFFFCLGSDLLRSLPRWDKGDKLVEEFQFLVIPRPGYELPGQVGLDDPDEMPPVSAAGLSPARSLDLPTGAAVPPTDGAADGAVPPPGDIRRQRTSFDKNIRWLTPFEGTELTLHKLSSSEIRRRAHLSWGEQERLNLEGGSMHLVEGLVPPAVLSHILRYGLYNTEVLPNRTGSNDRRPSLDVKPPTAVNATRRSSAPSPAASPPPPPPGVV